LQSVSQSVNLSVSQSVSQSVCGHKNEHFEQIRNACGFLLQWKSSKLKNNNLHFANKTYTKGCEKRGFSLNYQTKPHLEFNFSYLLNVLLVRKMVTISK